MTHQVPVRDGEPRVGYYKRRLVRNGPWIAARIWFHFGARDEAGDLLEDEGFRCEVDGKTANVYAEWPRLFGHPIDKDEFDRLRKLRTWAAGHAPDDAYAAPRQAVDLNAMKPLF